MFDTGEHKWYLFFSRRYEMTDNWIQEEHKQKQAYSFSGFKCFYKISSTKYWSKKQKTRKTKR